MTVPQGQQRQTLWRLSAFVINRDRTPRAFATARALGLLSLGMWLSGCKILTVSTANGRAGESVTLSVNLSTSGVSGVAGLQHRLIFDPVHTPVAARSDGSPDCTAIPSLDMAFFVFLPAGCTPGTNCTAIKTALMSSTATALPESTSLYTCRIQIPPGTPSGRYSVSVDGVQVAGPEGEAGGATGYGGYIDVTP